MYLATVDWATSMPSLSSSPWTRGAPHNPFARLIPRIRSRISRGIAGRPPLDRDFQRQKALYPPMPTDQCLGLDDRDSAYHARAEPVEPDERQSVGIGQP
jgi:hypothetical protein